MTNTDWSRRQFLKRSALFAGGAAIAPTFLTACGDDGGGGGLEGLKDKGTITVGIAGEQPFGFLESGKLTGEAPAVQGAVWKALGIDKVEHKQTQFDGLIPGLNAHHFDVVAAGMFITPERCDNAQFSDPVYCAPEAFLVRKGNPDKLTDFKSAAEAGVSIGVFGSAVEGDYAKQSGVAEDKVESLPDQQTGILQLQQGRVDAIALTSISLKWALQHQSAKVQAELEVTEPFNPVIDGKEILGCGGAVFRDDQDDLRKAFNKKLAELRKSGELLELVKPFGFDESSMVPDGVTSATLCKG